MYLSYWISASRSITDLLWQSSNLWQLGYELMFHLRYFSWLDSVHPQALCNGQRCTTSWNIWRATQASRFRIGRVTGNRTCCLGMQIRIGAIALLDNQRPACSCFTTNRRSHGSPRCRRLRLSRLQRPSTTLHQWRLWRLGISYTCCQSL
jgi:hypothetical protein